MQFLFEANCILSLFVLEKHARIDPMSRKNKAGTPSILTPSEQFSQPESFANCGGFLVPHSVSAESDCIRMCHYSGLSTERWFRVYF